MKLEFKEEVVDELLSSIGKGILKEICKQAVNSTSDFLKDATNVYRTKDYVVKQEIKIINDEDRNTFMVSIDTYYSRNDEIDECYECFFPRRKNLDGKRISVAMYTRVYVD